MKSFYFGSVGTFLDHRPGWITDTLLALFIKPLGFCANHVNQLHRYCRNRSLPPGKFQSSHVKRHDCEEFQVFSLWIGAWSSIYFAH